MAAEWSNPLRASGRSSLHEDPDDRLPTPNTGFAGSEVFSYTIVDLFGATDAALVTVEVTPSPGPLSVATSFSSAAPLSMSTASSNPSIRGSQSHVATILPKSSERPTGPTSFTWRGKADNRKQVPTHTFIIAANFAPVPGDNNNAPPTSSPSGTSSGRNEDRKHEKTDNGDETNNSQESASDEIAKLFAPLDDLAFRFARYDSEGESETDLVASFAGASVAGPEWAQAVPQVFASIGAA